MAATIMVDYSKNHSKLGLDLCRRVLDNCYRKLVYGMTAEDIKMILKETENTGLFSHDQVRDVSCFQSAQIQSRILLSKISQKGPNGYEKFASILFRTGKLGLLMELIDAEDALLKERMEQTSHTKITNQNDKKVEKPNETQAVVDYSKNHSKLDLDLCRRVLNRCHRKLVYGMTGEDIKIILKETERTGLLSYEQVRDVGGLQCAQMQSRIMLSKISQRGSFGYKKFARILFRTGKLGLLMELIDAEDALLKERMGHTCNTQTENRKEQVKIVEKPNKTQTVGERDGECNICMDARMSVVLIPCGHALCSGCGDRMLRENCCCFCKQSISRLQKLYF